MVTYQELRKETLTQICKARTHYFRLQKELEELTTILPDKCYIARYKSNSHRVPGHWYYALGCTDKALPCVRSKDPNNRNLTKKIHLGHLENPNYLTAVIELERSRVRRVKLDTCEAIRVHLKQKQAYWLARKRQQKNNTNPGSFAPIDREIKDENLFAFIVRKHYEQASSPDLAKNP